ATISAGVGSTVITPGSYTTFSTHTQTLGLGHASFDVEIYSDDSTYSPFVFTVKCQGSGPAASTGGSTQGGDSDGEKCSTGTGTGFGLQATLALCVLLWLSRQTRRRST